MSPDLIDNPIYAGVVVFGLGALTGLAVLFGKISTGEIEWGRSAVFSVLASVLTSGLVALGLVWMWHPIASRYEVVWALMGAAILAGLSELKAREILTFSLRKLLKSAVNNGNSGNDGSNES